ncbi:hypothetical protein BZA70DRAFT_285840 [Myxozyma melibiosi]|uniref:Uncharacterized protein n=1 Tax=Myxozyma melibiosi TaxID=54550 RepID=A0ABR1EY01_9ASCO
MFLAASLVAVDLAALESGLSIAGAGISAFAAASKIYSTVRSSRKKEPQRRDLDLASVTAYYVMRSLDTIRIPSNLELPDQLVRSSEPQRLADLQPVEPVPLPADSPSSADLDPVDHHPRFLYSRHLDNYRLRLRARFRSLLPFRSSPQSASATPPPPHSTDRPWWQRDHVYNVLSRSNDLLYTFERHQSGVWMLYSYPSRDLLATIRFRTKVKTWGPNARGHVIEFHDGPDEMRRRKIRRKSTMFDTYNVFYAADGAPYHWAATTRRLERVVNWRGKSDEIREVVGKAKPLRRGQINYELLIDQSKIDPVVAISTAFVSMKTQWSLSDCPIAQTRTRLP